METCSNCHNAPEMCNCLDKPGEPPERFSPVACSPVARHYGWMEKNMSKGFETWEAEVAHVEAMGYKLVPPEYYIPHWSTAMEMGDAKPKLYVLRNDGPDEVKTHFDCYAGQLGYPVYYRTNETSSATGGAQPASKP